MRKRNFLAAFAAVMISLLMLCGCSEDDVGEIEGTYVGTDISRYIDIEEEPTETLSETVSEDDTETSDGKIFDRENSNEEISDSETANDTIISEEITSADIPETSEEDLSETEKAVQKYYFRSEKLFDSHYEKHGAEFGDITQDEYLDLANELINAEGENIRIRPKKMTATSSIMTPKRTSSSSFPRTAIYEPFSSRAQAWTIGKDSNTNANL